MRMKYIYFYIFIIMLGGRGYCQSEYLMTLKCLLTEEIEKNKETCFSNIYLDQYTEGDVNQIELLCARLKAGKFDAFSFMSDHESTLLSEESSRRVGEKRLPGLSKEIQKIYGKLIHPLKNLKKLYVRDYPDEYTYGNPCMIIEVYNPIKCSEVENIFIYRLTILPAILSMKKQFIGYPPEDPGNKYIIIKSTFSNGKYNCKEITRDIIIMN